MDLLNSKSIGRTLKERRLQLGLLRNSPPRNQESLTPTIPKLNEENNFLL